MKASNWQKIVVNLHAQTIVTLTLSFLRDFVILRQPYLNCCVFCQKSFQTISFFNCFCFQLLTVSFYLHLSNVFFTLSLTISILCCDQCDLIWRHFATLAKRRWQTFDTVSSDCQNFQYTLAKVVFCWANIHFSKWPKI